MDIKMRFKGGLKKCLTLSYDDGVVSDEHLIEILNKYNIKGTFNLNTNLFKIRNKYADRLDYNSIRDLYLKNGMEVAVHTLTHPHLENLTYSECKKEVYQDRLNLELLTGCEIHGMAYPYGTYNDMVLDVLRESGIVYSRTTINTNSFNMPDNYLLLEATTHHKNPNLMKLAERFLNDDNSEPYLFYLWGHSYEFMCDDNWNVIEEFSKYLGNNENIWYATNIELYKYHMAYKSLIIDHEKSIIENPTATTVYIEVDGKNYKIEPRMELHL